jgi:hypothetical protein
VHHRQRFLADLVEAHQRLVGLRPHQGVPHPACDVAGQIAHALEVVVHLEHGDHETQVRRHGLVESKDLEALLLDFDLALVDHFVALDDLVDEGRIAALEDAERLVDGLFDESPHGEDLVLEVVEVALQMLGHGDRSFLISRNGRSRIPRCASSRGS